MSYAFNDFISCANQQEYLPEAFKGINPALVGKKSGLLDFIVSDLNEDGSFQRQINSGDGRRRTVELLYQPRIAESAVSSGARNDCSAGTERGETSKLYSIDPDTEGSIIKWSGTQTNLEERCEADSMYWARQLAMNMSALRRKISTDAATQVAAQFGNFVGGATDFTTSTKSGNAWLTDLIEDVNYQFDLMQAQESIWAFGMGDVSKYFDATNAGCCATTNVDLGEYAMQNSLNFMKDDSVRTVLGSNKFIATIPGAIQMLRYLEYQGETRWIDQPTYKQYTIPDPVNGLMYDFYAEFDCGVWKFALKLAYKFAVMPDDQFFDDDELSGVNWVNQFTISNS